MPGIILGSWPKRSVVCVVYPHGKTEPHGFVAMDGWAKWGWAAYSYMGNCYIISELGSKTSILCNQIWDI